MQEIISHVPNWIVRWGIIVILGSLVALLFISWFIRYPDVLTAKIVITTKPAPIPIFSRSSGSITLLKKEGEYVKRGEIFGYIQTNSSWQDVLALEEDIKNNLYKNAYGSLGELEEGWSRLITEAVALEHFEKTQWFNLQVFQLKKQEVTYKRLRVSLRAQERIARQELSLSTERFKTDSVLFTQQVIAALDFNHANSALLQQLRTSKNAEMAVINNELQLDQLHKQILELELQKMEQQQRLMLVAENARKELLARILKWKQTYLFTATETGKLAWLGILENDKFIDAGKPVATILPEHGNLLAHAELPIRGSGKVEVGQQVNIKLENYPFEEYGSITGKITYISEIPTDEKYFVTVELPDGLMTSTSQTLPFRQQLAGTAEIITEDMRLLDRILYQFRKLLTL
ncbi:MAG: HlyD family efflux transporter periplasmic adaptor subunit [Cyclobacteriaceae bacterium]|nr:HlyD family efflux transporter periplasmic adaptor subunit [Cyclobacteriaceae bacterium]